MELEKVSKEASTGGTQALVYQKLDDTEKKRVDDLVKQMEIEDSQGMVQYGISAQSNISSFADTILTDVRTKDTGHAGEALTELMITAKELKVDSLSSGSFLSNIPIIGSLFGGIKRDRKSVV